MCTCTLFNRSRVDQNYYPLCDCASFLRFFKVVHSFFIWLFCLLFLHSEFLMSSKKQTIVPFWVGKEAEIVREQAIFCFKSCQFCCKWSQRCDLILLSICSLEFSAGLSWHNQLVTICFLAVWFMVIYGWFTIFFASL